MTDRTRQQRRDPIDAPITRDEADHQARRYGYLLLGFIGEPHVSHEFPATDLDPFGAVFEPVTGPHTGRPVIALARSRRRALRMGLQLLTSARGTGIPMTTADVP